MHFLQYFFVCLQYMQLCLINVTNKVLNLYTDKCHITIGIPTLITVTTTNFPSEQSVKTYSKSSVKLKAKLQLLKIYPYTCTSGNSICIFAACPTVCCLGKYGDADGQDVIVNCNLIGHRNLLYKPIGLRKNLSKPGSANPCYYVSCWVGAFRRKDKCK